MRLLTASNAFTVVGGAAALIRHCSSASDASSSSKSNRVRLAALRPWAGETAGVGGAKLSKSRLSDTLSAVKALDRLILSDEEDAVDEGDVGAIDSGVVMGERKLLQTDTHDAEDGTAVKRFLRFLEFWLIGMVLTCTSMTWTSGLGRRSQEEPDGTR